MFLFLLLLLLRVSIILILCLQNVILIQEHDCSSLIDSKHIHNEWFLTQKCRLADVRVTGVRKILLISMRHIDKFEEHTSFTLELSVHPNAEQTSLPTQQKLSLCVLFFFSLLSSQDNYIFLPNHFMNELSMRIAWSFKLEFPQSSACHWLVQPCPSIKHF